jgi:hypothetical protein
MLSQVQRFYREVLGVELPAEPRKLPPARYIFKTRHLQEELEELRLSYASNNLEGQADALIDMAYVALGALLEMGILPGPAFDEVHSANMRRVRGETRRGDGTFDAVKPAGWKPPELGKLLSITREDVEWLLEQKEHAEAYEGQVQEPITLLGDPPIKVGPGDAVTTRMQEDGRIVAYRNPKILVIGHGRHGKDTVAEMLREEYGLRFTSSSLFCAERVVLPAMMAVGHQYATAKECFEDRHNHRELWYRVIEDFNTPDKTALARAILTENDVYVGLRSHREFHACRNAGLFDAVVWVDASERVPSESRGSMTLEPWMADYVLDNNGPDVEAMRPRLRVIMGRILDDV